jgi:hypothetical protein
LVGETMILKSGKIVDLFIIEMEKITPIHMTDAIIKETVVIPSGKMKMIEVEVPTREDELE